MRYAGEPEERLDRKVARAGAHAQDLTARAELQPQAWHWVGRVGLPDSERDWAWVRQHRNGFRVDAGIHRIQHSAERGGRHQLTRKDACASRRLWDDAGESPPKGSVCF